MAREIVRVIVGPIQCNCYIVSDAVSRQAYLIDPGAETRDLMVYLRNSKLELQGILITHGHLDHVGGIEMVLATYQAPVYYHAADMPLYLHLDVQAESMGFQLKDLEARQPAVGEPTLQEHREFDFSAGKVQVLHTPGHTPGSVCFYSEGEESIVFSGDTLFAGSIGRTDLWGGSFPQIMDSIRTRLLKLPDHVRVLPGHGDFTTIGNERTTNPFIRGYAY
ncbi:MAG TPA: MBL fold metallo-hydrolase [Acidobacteriota bacterium]|nr:MBL fold metallo-hydrolase [Acidobacteriota bacterium]